MGPMKIFMRILKTPLQWFRKMYAWTIHWSKKKEAPYALFSIAFAESSFFPIPPDVLLIPMVLAQKKKWFVYAGICTLGSVCGALLGYFIGWGLFETVGKFIVQAYHLEEVIQIVGRKYQDNAFLTIFTAAFTPIPYKAITITAGLFKISLGILVVASVIGRAGRFFLVAISLRIFGKKIEDSIEKYFDIFSVIFMALAILGIIALKRL
ncbi:MAG TPA: cytochrome B [Candidatus Omnitrophica bacterium]|nr:cytochrome B [Candidatus Omnitrophota bacterium]